MRLCALVNTEFAAEFAGTERVRIRRNPPKGSIKNNVALSIREIAQRNGVVHALSVEHPARYLPPDAVERCGVFL